jgi:hypothetical protein
MFRPSDKIQGWKTLKIAECHFGARFILQIYPTDSDECHPALNRRQGASLFGKLC